MNPLENKYVRITWYGFLAWLVPFVSSFFFFSSNGLIIDQTFFKSIMIAVGSITAAVLIIYYFKKVSANYFHEGVLIGILWFVINIGLDLLILLPMSGMSIPDYFMQIGLRYLAIPAMCVVVGTSLENKK